METNVAAMPASDLAAGLAAGLERFIGLFRSLSPASGLSMAAAATLAGIERFGPQRLTLLAAREGVTQPAMTQLISRLRDAGLVHREPSPEDGRVVIVTITDEGRAALARCRAGRTERLAAVLAQLSPEQRAALAAALPALDTLASMSAHPRPSEPVRREQDEHRAGHHVRGDLGGDLASSTGNR